MRFATRISPELLDAIGLLDDGERPIAEVWRLAGEAASALGEPRPSYEQVREWVHEIRGGGWDGPTFGSAAKIAVEIAFRAKAPMALADHVWQA